MTEVLIADDCAPEGSETPVLPDAPDAPGASATANTPDAPQSGETTETSVSVAGLTITYPDSNWVLPAFTHDFPRGSYTVITGPNGSGKTTLALALAEVLTEVSNAQVTGEIKRSGRLRAIWQHPEDQMCTTSVLDEVRSPLDYLLAPASFSDRRWHQALAEVGLSHIRPGQDPLTLSGGEQQRLALAAALVAGPDILILDEAFSRLDSEGRARLHEVLLSQRQKKPTLTIIAIDHHLDWHRGLADHLLCLGSDGRIDFSGNFPATALADPDTATSSSAEASTSEASVSLTDATVFSVNNLTCWPGGKTPKQRSNAKTAPSGEAKPLFTDLSFTASAGEVLLLTGPNGAGKSTLLSALASQDTPKTAITPAWPERLRQGIGYVPQIGGELLSGTVVADEIKAAIQAGHKASHAPKDTSETSPEQIENWLELVNLGGKSDSHPLRLSGGQRQRLAVLLAVLANPKTLLLDEPFSAQDQAGKLALCRLLTKTQHERTTVIATHDTELPGVANIKEIRLPGRPQKPETTSTTSQSADATQASPVTPTLPTPWLNPLVTLTLCMPAIGAILSSQSMWVPVVVSIVGFLACLRRPIIGLKFTVLNLVTWALMTLGFLLWLPQNPYGTASAPIEWLGGISHDRMWAALLGGSRLAAMGFIVFGVAMNVNGKQVTDTTIGALRIPYRLIDVTALSGRFFQSFRLNYALALRLSMLRLGRRGLWRSHIALRTLLRNRWHAFIAVLMSALRSGDRLSVALESRGFGTYTKRTLHYRVPFRWWDWPLTVIVWVATIVFWMAFP